MHHQIFTPTLRLTLHVSQYCVMSSSLGSGSLSLSSPCLTENPKNGVPDHQKISGRGPPTPCYSRAVEEVILHIMRGQTYFLTVGKVLFEATPANTSPICTPLYVCVWIPLCMRKTRSRTAWSVKTYMTGLW